MVQGISWSDREAEQIQEEVGDTPQGGEEENGGDAAQEREDGNGGE